LRSRRVFLPVTAAALAMLTAGSFPASAQVGKTPLKIAIVAKSEANVVFLVARRGAEAAAQEQAAKAGVPVEIVWRTPPREDPHVQAERIGQAVSEGVGGILVACSDIATLTPAINAAVDKGVAVMTFDSDAPESKRFAFYGVDETDLAEKLLGDLSEQLGGKGKIAVLAGHATAPNLVRRAEAIKKVAAARYPGIEVVEVVNHRETPAEAAEAVIRVDAARPDLVGWAMVGGWPLRRSSQTPALLDELQRRKLKVVAVDALPEQLLYVDKGLVPVLWAQPNFLWGKVGVETIVDKVVRKKAVPEKIRMPLVRVTRQNLGTWARQLQSWGFTGIPEDYLKLP
jgi:ribose transport system substrate-binding protein